MLIYLLLPQLLVYFSIFPALHGFNIFRGLVEEYTKCAIATGTLICSSNSSLHKDVEVFLMDDDGVGNFDDKMGWDTSNEDGYFEVKGCGYDFLSDPDPYVKIFTYCNAPRGKHVKTRVVHTFSPEKINYGSISLD